MEKVKVWIRRFIAQNFSSVVSLFETLRFNMINLKKNEPIIVHSMGKVGSSSVYQSLKKKLKNPVFHTHHLNPAEIKKAKFRHLRGPRNSLPHHLIISEILQQKLTGYNGKLYIISLLREPIGRQVSGFFQNLNLNFKELEDDYLNLNTELIETKLNEKFSGYDNSEEKWLKNELGNYFGINVIEKDFNIERGYSIYERDNIRLLLIKMEKLDLYFLKAIKELLENEKLNIELAKHNKGSEKYYAGEYNIIKSNFTISPEVISEIVRSRYFDKYYSDNSQDILNNWKDSETKKNPE